jgi:hypothetical protein
LRRKIPQSFLLSANFKRSYQGLVVLGCVAGAGLELELCAGADELELAGALLDEDSAGALFLSSVRLSLLLLEAELEEEEDDDESLELEVELLSRLSDVSSV